MQPWLAVRETPTEDFECFPETPTEDFEGFLESPTDAFESFSENFLGAAAIPQKNLEGRPPHWNDFETSAHFEISFPHPYHRHPAAL